MERLVFVVLREVLAKACVLADADVATRLGVLSEGDRCCSPWELACRNETFQFYPSSHQTLLRLYSRVSKRLLFDIRKVV